MPIFRGLARRLWPLAVCLSLATSARAQGFTLEQVLSSPFPSALVASRDGRRVAWVFRAQGRRNVWAAEAPRWRGRQLTRVGRESSPITSVDKWKSPVLLIHGDDDRNVQFTQSVMLVRELRKHNVEFEQLVFPDEVHDFLRHENWLRAYRASADFFDQHLKSRR